ncbi:SsgA family sporulation/cell division regulator [Streptomyces phyllanthi]|uniref:SsgA family sporulation/cell division regulator n=1 Tax=Streptomyces phyllanthi TaxID=1803180 RepID=A0A5N8WBX5_9ACTN|nr:SsgA family sporulation/cell division regulator [Streptomyces phyllanthi]MPY43864.1 SsgA family sporulation/cell division regulator [Streptomyces phyllanthi]
MHITLEQPARACLVTDDDQELPVPATLRYTSDDPLAVSIDFPADVSLAGEEITWTFARALLDEGLCVPVGNGDVHIWPLGQSHTVVEFHSPYGLALIQFDAEALRRFLLCSYAVVAAGSEDMGPALDRDLTALLG